jgi:hypothetical protein
MADAGWYPDPLGRADTRHFDGVSWRPVVKRDGAIVPDVMIGIDIATLPSPEDMLAGVAPMADAAPAPAPISTPAAVLAEPLAAAAPVESLEPTPDASFAPSAVEQPAEPQLQPRDMPPIHDDQPAFAMQSSPATGFAGWGASEPMTESAPAPVDAPDYFVAPQSFEPADQASTSGSWGMGWAATSTQQDYAPSAFVAPSAFQEPSPFEQPTPLAPQGFEALATPDADRAEHSEPTTTSFGAWTSSLSTEFHPHDEPAAPDVAPVADASGSDPLSSWLTPKTFDDSETFSASSAFDALVANPSGFNVTSSAPIDTTPPMPTGTNDIGAGELIGLQASVPPQPTSAGEFWALPFAAADEESSAATKSSGDKNLLYVEVAGVIVGLVVLVYLIVTFVI